MLEKMNEQTELSFKDLTAEEKERRGILARLYGPCASVITATRNGRKYSNALWEKVFDDPTNKELLEKGGIPGEMDHPEGRSETCSEKIAIMMPEAPKKDEKGNLIGYWDIIDTPCGRIAYALAKYGFKLGISSRGEGEIVSDWEGNESVDPNTYHFNAFDLVLIPACKDARLTMVESLGNKTLKQTLNEELNKATADERKIMTETLNNLNIEYTPEKVIDKSNMVANNAGTNMIKELQDSLLANKKLEDKITELQEKLSVCYAKEAKVEEDIEKYKTAIRNLSESASKAKALEVKYLNLNEELSKRDSIIQDKDKEISRITESKSREVRRQQSLNETITNKDRALREKDLLIEKLNREIKSIQSDKLNKENSLNESLEELRKDLTIKTAEYRTKLSNSNQLVERYRETAKTAVNKYIDSQALRLGINAEEVKNKLPNNYSFNDIDRICESLSRFNLAVNNLPLSLQKKETKIKVTESIEPLLGSNSDDAIDDGLLRIANLK